MGEGFPNVSQYRFYKRMPIRVSIIYPYLAASGVTQIHEDGHGVCFMDCPTEEKTWIDVEHEVIDSDIVFMEGRTPIIFQIWDAIRIVKEMNPDVKVAVYGDHVSWDPKETLSQGADFILKGGDFDWAAAWLCNALEEKMDPGRIIDLGLHENLDGLPWVDRELINWRNYYEAWRKRDVFLWNMSSRGCFYRCTYCAWAETFWQNTIRYRSPENVAMETLELWNKHGDLEMLDDSDLFNFRWGKHFAAQLLKMGFKDHEVLWSCQSHPAMIKRLKHPLEDLKFMESAGLRVVKLGIESSHDVTLHKIRKGSSRKLAEESIKLLQKAGVMVHANMMIGFPWETREDVLETVDWLKKLDPNQAQFSLLIPYPNTEIWRESLEKDLFIQDPRNWSNYDATFPMLRMEGLNGNEVVELYQKAWSRFYLDPKYIWKHLKTVRHLEGLKHLLRGFKSVYFGHMRAAEKRSEKCSKCGTLMRKLSERTYECPKCGNKISLII